MQHIIKITNPTVICLQETFLNVKKSPTLAGYHRPLVRKERLNCAGGGVLIAVKADIPFTTLQINTELELIAIQLQCGAPLIIVTAYFPPDLEINTIKGMFIAT